MKFLLEVNELSKCYSMDLKKSIKYASQELLKSTLGLKSTHDSLKDSEFWALRDVNFKLCRGDVLAILGHNGAGKSTLLKCIANKIKPSHGKVILNGQMGHMIEMSAGFDQSLTGRENVAMRGRLLQFRGKSLQSYIEKVKEFSDIDDFFDAPVQFYSSGMKSRLGFAASSCIEPDILIIDEVLAVGDLGFRLKCYERMNELAKKCAVIFVSHSLGQVSRMCNRAIYLEKGKVLHDGGVQQALSLYQDKLGDLSQKKKFTVLNANLISFNLYSNNILCDSKTKIDYGSNLSLSADISQLPSNVIIRALLRDASGTVILDWNSAREILSWPENHTVIDVNLGEAEFAPGAYNLSIEVMSCDRNDYICLSEPMNFRVGGEYYNALAIQRRASWIIK